MCIKIATSNAHKIQGMIIIRLQNLGALNEQQEAVETSNANKHVI